MISVCMATHNGEQHIDGQLASILRQLGPQDEVVISDDSSSDSTLEIIRSFGDARIRLLEGNRFFNPIYNFENALKHAAGDIIALADQDDLWLDNKIEVILQSLPVSQGRPALVMMDGYIIDGNGRRTGQTIFEKKPPKKSVLANLYDNTFTGCSMAFNRELLEVALPFPAGIPMHDSWLGMTALLSGEVQFIETKTIEYRRHALNVSRRHRNPFVQIRWRACLAYHLLQRFKKDARQSEP